MVLWFCLKTEESSGKFFLVFCTPIQSSVCQHFPVIQLCFPLIVQLLANELIKHLLVVCFVCIFLVTSFVQRISLIETWFVSVFSFSPHCMTFSELVSE